MDAFLKRGIYTLIPRKDKMKIKSFKVIYKIDEFKVRVMDLKRLTPDVPSLIQRWWRFPTLKLCRRGGNRH